MKFKNLILFSLLMTSVMTLNAQNKPGRLNVCQSSFSYVKTITSDYKYLLFLPAEYFTTKSVKFPVIIFLHGSGERGDSIDLVKKNGIPSFVEQKSDFRFIMVAPQCPEGEIWDADRVIALLDDVQKQYKVDPNRIYLTGLSMGGFGTWDIACKYPERFAAIAPVCGGGFSLTANKLKNVPVWAFHGAKDDVVLPYFSESMVNAVNQYGGNAKLTLYPEANHNSWTETYNNPELYTWFLSHKKAKK